MNAPFFSVLIPTFCRARLCAEALDSVLAQDFADFEVVVSDNWSADDTSARLDAYSDERILRTKPRRHGSTADNLEHARSVASGRYLLPLRAVDALVVGALQSLHHALTSTGASMCVVTAATLFDDPEHPEQPPSGLQLPGRSGRTIRLSAADFLSPLYAFRPLLPTHIGFAVERAEATRAAERFGVLFAGEDPEYFAWPALLASLSSLAFVDKPLVVARHITRPPEEHAADGTSDNEVYAIHHAWENAMVTAPVVAHTEANLIAEGLWTAQERDPDGVLRRYGRDEHRYAESMSAELNDLRKAGKAVGEGPANFVRWAATLPAGADRAAILNRRKALLAIRYLQLRRLRGFQPAVRVDCSSAEITSMVAACRYVGTAVAAT